jgi:hypothetical protein
VYCGSYICNSISYLVGFFLLCLPHSCYLSLSTDQVIQGHWKKKMKPTPTSQCYSHCHHLEVSKFKKIRPHSTFSHTLCLLLSHLAHFDEDPSNQQRKRLKTPHRSTKVEDHLSSSIVMFLFISLLLVFSFFKSRDEIPFKGVDLSHPEISNFRK